MSEMFIFGGYQFRNIITHSYFKQFYIYKNLKDFAINYSRVASVIDYNLIYKFIFMIILNEHWNQQSVNNLDIMLYFS